MSTKKFAVDCGIWLRKNVASLWRGIKGENIKVSDTQVLCNFEQPETIKNFVCLSDNEVGGNSEAKLTTSKHGRLLFSGNVSTDIDKNVSIDHSGFCGIRSKPIAGLFNKVETVDMSYYDCIEIKYRGDGRPYFINIQTESMMLLNQYDLFQSFLFTKGGPYWEVERLPFSKFLMTYQGYLQDEQFDFSNVRTIGLSLSDKKSGPFSLEIEYLKMIKIGFQPMTFRHLNNRRFQPE